MWWWFAPEAVNMKISLTESGIFWLFVQYDFKIHKDDFSLNF